MNNFLIIKVTGKNIYKFITKCKCNRINLIDIKYISNNQILIKINYDDYIRINKIKSIYNIEIINKIGIIKIKEYINRYKVLIVTFLFGILLLVFLSNTIFYVNIVTDNNSLKTKLINDLRVYGISKYSHRKNYSEIKKIKNKILDKYKDYIEWIEIDKVGTKYNILIVERRKNRKKEKEKYTNIVAKKSGMLKSVIVEDGSKVIDKNNYVNKGEIIISGIIKKDDEIKGITRAKGKVYAEVWYNVSIEYPLNYTEKRYTNNYKKSLYIKISKRYFDIKKYKNFKRENIISYKNKLVPFEIGIEKQNEVIYIKDKLSIKEAKKRAILKSRKRLLNTLDKNSYIISQKTLNFTQKNSKIILDMFFSCFEEIGKEEDIIME